MKITNVIARFVLGLIFLVFRTEQLLPLHSRASSAFRNSRPVRGAALRLQLSGRRISAANHPGSPAPD